MEVPNKCPLELVEVESEDKDGGVGRIEGEQGLEAADHEDPVVVAANEAGALEDVEDVPPFMALEARPRRRRSCGRRRWPEQRSGSTSWLQSFAWWWCVAGLAGCREKERERRNAPRGRKGGSRILNPN